MISNKDAEKIYNQLTSFMRQKDLGWIVDQMEEQITLGIVETKKLKVNDIKLFYDDEGDAQRKKAYKSSSTFVVSRPYTAQKKLKLLIDSLEIGVIRVTEIADEISLFISKETNSEIILFEPEGDLKKSFEIKWMETIEAREKVKWLGSLLNELRKEI